MGEVERIGRFARGAATRPGCRRAAFIALVAALAFIVAHVLLVAFGVSQPH